MSKTPKTDAIVRPYIDCKEINPEEVDALLDHARKQEIEIAALTRWKEEAIAVEKQWDVQAVAKALNLKLGMDVRPQILPAVMSLRERVERLEGALGMSTPYPITEVLRILFDAVEHLLADHCCDHHGHEIWRGAQKAASVMHTQITEALAQKPLAPGNKTETP